MLRYQAVTHRSITDGGEMLAEALAAAAAAGGTAMVQAAGTDAWASVRSRIARAFGQGNPRVEAAVSAELDQAATAVRGSPEQFAAVRRMWQSRFEGLLQELDPPEREMAAQLLREAAAVSQVTAAVGPHSLAVSGRLEVSADPGGVAAGVVESALAVRRAGVAAGQVEQLNVYLQKQIQFAAAILTPPYGRRDPAHPLRGRDILLAELVDQLTDDHRDGRVHVLHGMGGAGKSALALEIAYLARQTGSRIWWVRATDGEALVSGLRTVAVQAGVIEEELGTHDLGDALWAVLNRSAEPWLLVVDGADNTALLDGSGALHENTGLVRAHQSPGLVLVTTREASAAAWGTSAVLHRVAGLPTAEPTAESTASPSAAAAVLLDQAGPGCGSPQEAEHLARRLGGLPLALRLAGGYLAEAREQPWPSADTISSFLAFQHVLDQDTASSLEPLVIVRSTLMLSLERLDSSGIPEAKPLLSLLAAFADAPLPYVLVLAPEELEQISGLEHIDGTRLWRALKLLAELNLIELNTQSTAVPLLHLHPLVRDTLRAQFGSEPEAAARRLINRASTRQGSIDDPATWPRWEMLAPHAFFLHRHVVQQSAPPADVIAIGTAALQAARYLDRRGLYPQAASRVLEVFEGRRELLGDDHRATMAARLSLAREHRKQGDLDAADRELEEVVQYLSRTLGDDDLDTAEARHTWAMVLRERGDLAAAERECQAAERVRTAILGPNHPDTLAVAYSLARIHRERGEHTRALAAYERVYQTRRSLLGDLHPDTLATRHSLAWVARRQGHLHTAEAEFKEVYAARRRILGDHHAYTLLTRTELALLAWETGDREHAQHELQEIHALRERTLGREHPHTRWTLQALHQLQNHSATAPTPGVRHLPEPPSF
ncbi:tetratricopeptide repeat protein [Streptomyces sp. NPDC007971]|uniref:tetratricopeptide repeat protein n=1 Tax=Streptomyces sp. NPDC007971 TaxID=3364799 RepID=UPI0036E682EE